MVSVVQALYEAALQPEHWPDALDGVRRLFGGAASTLFLQDAATGEIPLWLSVGTEDGEDEFFNEVKNLNPRTPLAKVRPPGTVLCDYHVLTERAMDRDPFYDWLDRTHGYRYFLGSRVLEEGPLSGFAAIQWSRSHGHADDADVDAFMPLLPHIAQAIRLTKASVAAQRRTQSIETAVELLDCGIIALDQHGRVLFCNARAEAVLERADGLVYDSGGLRALKAADTRSLRRMIAAAMAEGIEQQLPQNGLGVIARQGGGTPYMVSACPVPRKPIGPIAPEAAVLVVVREPSAASPSRDVLHRLFGLTPREAELATHLQRGDGVPAAAARCGMAANTARVHLKSIFAKTGVRSQVELAALLARLPSTS